jgi:hypothetical protein
MRRRIHACHVSYEEEDTCMSCVIYSFTISNSVEITAEPLSAHRLMTLGFIREGV